MSLQAHAKRCAPMQSKVPPPLFPHQTALLEETWQHEAFAIFWECGCGKTAPTIHTAVRLYNAGKIDGAVVIAPRGVHRAWVSDEIPRHCAIEWNGLDWHSDRGKGQDRALAELLNNQQKLLFFACTFEGIITARGRAAVLAFKEKCPRFMLVIDEGSRVKNPTALRTKKVAALRKLARYVRLLNGTPSTNSALDVYAQMKILDENYWVRHGIGSWTAFQARFAVMKKIVVGGEDDRDDNKVKTSKRDPIVPHGAGDVDLYEQLDLESIGNVSSTLIEKHQPNGDVSSSAAEKHQPTIGRTIEVVVGFRELDRLREMLQPMSSRLTKEAAGLNLPPKLYSRILFDLHPEQRRAYDQLRREYMLELDSGTLVTATLALVRVLRLQQLACGFLPDVENPDAPPQLFPRDGHDPRIEHLLELCEDLPPSIIWARFTYDIDRITRELGPARCVRYDGEVSGPKREIALDRFRSGKARFIIAKAASMGVGLTINEASAHVFYSNTFSLLDRVQAEDRSHRPGQHKAVTYYDLIAARTVDEKILRSLRESKNISDQLTGDSYRAWLEEG